ncbi:MAG: hypothetical protein KAT65_11415, partial [Methanophagales archaeon]|nr:hypothetical protein [Methanophagales archaeon]
GKEKELTVIDSAERVVTVKKPVKKVVVLGRDLITAMKIIKATDKLVAIDTATASDEVFFPELSKLPAVGTIQSPDHEAILTHNPDVVISYAVCKRWGDMLEEKLPDSITVVRLDFTSPLKMTSDTKKTWIYLRQKE